MQLLRLRFWKMSPEPEKEDTTWKETLFGYSYLEKLVEEYTETKGPEKPEESIAQPGLLKRFVFGIGSTALGAGIVTG